MTETIAIPAGKIVGIPTSIFTIFNKEKYDPQAIPSAWKTFFEKSEGTPLAAGPTFYGASIPSMSLDEPMKYIAGVLLEVSAEVPNGFESVDISAGNYLSVTHTGPISNVASSYQRAYMQELSASGKEMRPAPHLEIYSSNKEPMDSDYEMSIAIPVN